MNILKDSSRVSIQMIQQCSDYKKTQNHTNKDLDLEKILSVEMYVVCLESILRKVSWEIMSSRGFVMKTDDEMMWMEVWTTEWSIYWDLNG